MKHARIYLLLTLLAAASLVQAQEEAPVQRSGEVLLSDEALQLKYITKGERFGVENTDVSVGLFLSEERDFVLSAGLLMDTQLLDFIRLERLKLRLGVQGYGMLLGNEDDDIVAFAGGGEVSFVLFPRGPITIKAYGYYAPDILSFGQGDNVHDIGVTIEGPLTERLTGFAGYRDFDVELIGDATQLQGSIILGVRYQF